LFILKVRILLTVYCVVLQRDLTKTALTELTELR